MKTQLVPKNELSGTLAKELRGTLAVLPKEALRESRNEKLTDPLSDQNQQGLWVLKRTSYQIENCYIAVEIDDEVVRNLKRSLLESLKLYGAPFEKFEEAGPSVHVSLAYGQGKTDLAPLIDVVQRIAQSGFQIDAGRFEILEGQSTPFDYLVLALDAESSSHRNFRQAQAMVQSCMETKKFSGGFKGHLSLLRVQKGTISRQQLNQLMRELNASQGAATALGRRLCLDGKCVCIFKSDRECLVQVQMKTELPHKSSQEI